MVRGKYSKLRLDLDQKMPDVQLVLSSLHAERRGTPVLNGEGFCAGICPWERKLVAAVHYIEISGILLSETHGHILTNICLTKVNRIITYQTVL